MSDDLISRKAVIDILENMIFAAGKDLTKVYSLQDVRERVIRLNAVFDKEKVIEELRSEAGRWHESGVEFKDENEKGVAAGFRLATHIVEKGGLN